jgi:dihydrofolate reductase
LRYSINITLDGCADHEAITPDAETHAYWAENLARADALLLGRTIYQMMEEAWRRPVDGWPAEWSPELVEFAETMDAARKYVVSSTLESVDWNSTLVDGDLATAVQALKDEPGEGIFVGGLTLPLALADLGLIDEYEFLVHPYVVGHGPTLFAGLHERLDLELIDHKVFSSGAIAVRYRPKA